MKSQQSNNKTSRVKLSQNVTDSIILFDNDEFYALYLEILLFGFGQGELIAIQNSKGFNKFKQVFEQGDFNNNIYIIDELFGWGDVDIPQVVKNIRLLDKSAKVWGWTASAKVEMPHQQIYDQVLLKSTGSAEQSMTQYLADALGVEITDNVKDPEHKHA